MKIDAAGSLKRAVFTGAGVTAGMWLGQSLFSDEPPNMNLLLLFGLCAVTAFVANLIFDKPQNDPPR